MKSTWERTTEFLHPYVSFLVSGIQTLREDIRNKQWSKAARYLYWFIPYLDPEIKEKLSAEQKKLKEMLEGTIPFSQDSFEKILDKIMDELHKQGYFAGAKHKIIYVGSEEGIEPPTIKG